MSPLPLLVLLGLVVPLRAGYSVPPFQLRRGGALGVRERPLPGPGRAQDIFDPDTRGSPKSHGGRLNTDAVFNPGADTITINGIGGTISVTPAVFDTSIDINRSTSAGVERNTNSGTPTGPGSGAASGAGAEFGPGADSGASAEFGPGAASGAGAEFGPGSDLSGASDITSVNRFGTNQNRNTRVGAGFGVNSGPNSIPNAATVAGAGFDEFTATSPRPASTTRKPFSTRFGPDFGMLPGHVRRKTCTTFVNLTAEYDLRLIQYDIPVQGPGAPPTGCARDEVRFGTGDGPCVPALSQGPCTENQWVLLDQDTNVGRCVDRRCEVGSAFVEATGFCHDQFEAGFCPGDRLIAFTASGEPVCTCDDGWYPDRCGVCQLLYSHEGCPSGLAYQFNTEFQLRCLPSPCPAGRPVVLPGGLGCSVFGTSCRYRENNVTATGEWGLLTDSLEVACISPTVSRRRRDLSALEQSGQEVSSRGHGSVRFKRAVLANQPLLSCLPGERHDHNNNCRNKAAPARSRRAISTRTPTCERGRTLVNGRCIRTGGAFASEREED